MDDRFIVDRQMEREREREREREINDHVKLTRRRSSVANLLRRRWRAEVVVDPLSRLSKKVVHDDPHPPSRGRVVQGPRLPHAGRRWWWTRVSSPH